MLTDIPVAMNFILILFLSSVCFADGNGFAEFFRFLARPDGSLQALNCPDTADAPHCQDLAAAVCARRRGSARTQIQNNISQRLGDRSFETRRSAIRAAHQQVMNRAPVRWEEISQHYISTRTSLMRAVTDQPGIPENTRNQMVSKITNMKIIDSDIYFSEGLSRNSQGNLTNTQNALMLNFVQKCGETGMNENMFIDGDSIVVCPGALFQGIDSGALSSEDYLNSLTFMIAHESSKAISSSQFPDVYRTMSTCIADVMGSPSYWQQKGDELSADYWSTRVLSQRLALTGVSNNYAVAALFQNFGRMCGQDQGMAAPSTTDMLNLIVGRNPVMREVLGCLAPTTEKPVCGLMGKQP